MLFLLSLLAISSISVGYSQTVDIQSNKLQVIDAVIVDVDENCNLLSKSDDSVEYTEQAIAQSNDVCKKGMAWLKIECDTNYDQSQICRENMPAIKTYLARHNFDERDTKYFHNEYEQNRLVTQLDPDTMTIVQEKKETTEKPGLNPLLLNPPPINWTEVMESKEQEKKEKEAKSLAREKASQEAMDEMRATACNYPIFQQSALCDPRFEK